MDASDRANLAALVSRHADDATRSRQSALAALIDEGIVDADGKLTPTYGGRKEKGGRGNKKANTPE